MPEIPRPPVVPPNPWHAPVPRERLLSNGLRVLAFDRPGQHVASVGVVLDLPLDAEPREIEGVAALTLRTLDEGTHAHPGVGFAEALEDHGAVLSGSLGYAATMLGLNVPARAGLFGPALGLLSEALAAPTLEDADVEGQRGIRLAQIEQLRAQPSARASNDFRAQLIDGAARESRMSAGEAGTVAHVDGAAVRRFHAVHYRPEHATLVVAGDFGADVLDEVERAFGAWEGRRRRPAHPVPPAAGRSCLLVDRPGSVQADVRLGRLTIDRADPRWPAFQVAGYSLGGAFLSRLNRVLREEKGYTYGVHLATQPMRGWGISAIQGSFRTEVVADALALALDIADVAPRPLERNEVEAAVTYMTGVTPVRLATADGLVEQTMALEAAGLDLAFVDRNLAALRAVTPEEATQAARELFDPRDLSLVVVGDVTGLAEPLARLGFDVRTTR